MKKIILILLVFSFSAPFVKAQTMKAFSDNAFVSASSNLGETYGAGQKSLTTWSLPSDGSTSGNTRAPGNASKYQRTQYLITASEMAASGFPSGYTIDGIGFLIATAGGTTQTGNFKVYLRNTTDVTYTLGTNWTTTGFTLVSDIASWTVPIAAGSYVVPFTGGSSFTYTGGGVYVAWEFSNPGTVGTTPALVANCNTALTGGLYGNRSATSLPAALVGSNFRPATQFINNAITDIATITNIYTLEKVAVGYGTPTPISVRANNVSNAPATFDVILTVKDPTNTITRFTATQTVTALAANSSTILTFTGWNPTIQENVNVLATTSAIPTENWTTNNSLAIQSNVNNEIQGYIFGNSAASGFGFTYPGTGVFASKFYMNGNGYVNGANLFISSDAAATGNTIYAVVINSAGIVVAQSGNYVILSGDLGTSKSFTFPIPPSFTNEDYYVGLAQTAGTAQYYPMGTVTESPQRDGVFYTTTLTGGTMLALATTFNLKYGIEAKVGLPPPCLAPSALTATGVTQTSATISWTPSGTETSWEYVYGISPLPAPTGTGTVTSNTSIPLSGLTSNTTYQFYVRANCGAQYSVWSGPYSFTTLCDPVTLPYTQNFDGVIVPGIPSCMKVTNDNSDAETWQSVANYSRSAPNSMSISYNSTMAMNDWFFTPAFQLTPATYKVSFWYRNSGTLYPEKLEVKWGTGASAFGMSGGTIFANSNITNAAFQEGTGTFTVTTAGNYYVGWHGFSDMDMWYIAIDDILIEEQLPCLNPSAGVFTNITQNAATLSWTPGGNETLWDLEYGINGFTQGTGTMVNGLTSPTYNFTGLTANTNYDVYFRADCGGAGTSNWVGPLDVTTLCNIVIPTYLQNFESTVDCWTISSGTSNNWNVINTASGFGVGTSSLIANFYNFQDATPFYLFTPTFDLAGMTNPMLKFDYAYATYQTEIDSLNVLYSTDNGNTFYVLQYMPGGPSGILNTAGLSSNAFVPTPSQWDSIIMPLPAGTDIVVFEAISAYGNNLYLDNVKIYEPVLNKTLNLKAYVEGLFYDGSGNYVSGNMHPVYDGGTSLPLFGATIADTLTVELVDATYTNIVARYTGVNLMTNGDIQITTVAPSLGGNYYVNVIHRNSVPIATPIAISFASSSITHNFTTGLTYGGTVAQKEVEAGVFAMYSGELNRDAFYIIDGTDLSEIEVYVAAGTVAYVVTDLDGNGWVDGSDLSLLEPNVAQGPYFLNPLTAKKKSTLY